MPHSESNSAMPNSCIDPSLPRPLMKSPWSKWVKLLKIDSGCFKFPKCSKSIQISSKKTCTIIQSTISSATCQTCQLLVNACNFALADSPLFQGWIKPSGGIPDGLQPRSGSPAWSAGSDFRRSRRTVSWSNRLEMKDHLFAEKWHETSWNRLRRIIMILGEHVFFKSDGFLDLYRRRCLKFVWSISVARLLWPSNQPMVWSDPAGCTVYTLRHEARLGVSS